MITLGVDLSIAHCGLAVVDSKNAHPLQMAGCWKPKGTHPMRRQQLLDVIKVMHQRSKFGIVVMEVVPLRAMKDFAGPAILALVGLATTIEDWTWQNEIDVIRVATVSWRKIVLGNGRAKKEDAIAFARRKFGRIAQADQAEAICQACYPAMMTGWRP